MAKRDGASADIVRAAARRHGFSEGAVEALWDALVRGRGQAQFSHPELGGMGQWSGAMLQIGDMFNAGLKAKVAAACADLAASAEESRAEAASVRQEQRQRQGAVDPEGWSGAGPPRTSVPRTGFATFDEGLAQPRPSGPSGRWPGRYGPPAISGSQNGLHYAYFPDRRRLVVDREGCVTVYDTGDHRLTGVSQQQSRSQSLVFTSQRGTADLGSFVEVDA